MKKKIYKFDTSTIGAKLKALRARRELSMRELAARAGVAVSFISKIESGKTSPTIMTLQKILEALNVEVVEFFSDEPQALPADSIVFKRRDMKTLQGDDREWSYAFPALSDIGVVMTFEEFQPKTRVGEWERHNEDVCGYVISGEMTLEIRDRGVFKARKGDAFYLKAGTDHLARNDTERLLKIIFVELKR